MLFRSTRSVRGLEEASVAIRGASSAREFARILRRERDRADRTRDVLALVALEIDAHRRSDAAFPRRLARLLRARLRSTDEFGWLADRRLGIALPHTSASGAWTLVAALRQELERHHEGSGLSFSVYLHSGGASQDRNSSGGDGSPSLRETVLHLEPPPERRQVLALEALLLRPPGAAKRALDLVLGGSGLVLALPVMALAAVAIKCTSRGPVLFRQVRAGYGGRPFTFYKLRTMIDGAERIKQSLAALNEADGPVFKITRDPRVTFVGRLLRKTSIDELPQLWNVLRGDMSIVGPRPPTMDEITHYESWQRRRLSGIGGLTCFWQVRGRSNVGFLDWVRLDLRYLERRSFALDLLLVVLTIPAVLACRGAK